MLIIDVRIRDFVQYTKTHCMIPIKETWVRKFINEFILKSLTNYFMHRNYIYDSRFIKRVIMHTRNCYCYCVVCINVVHDCISPRFIHIFSVSYIWMSNSFFSFVIASRIHQNSIFRTFLFGGYLSIWLFFLAEKHFMLRAGIWFVGISMTFTFTFFDCG